MHCTCYVNRCLMHPPPPFIIDTDEWLEYMRSDHTVMKTPAMLEIAKRDSIPIIEFTCEKSDDT